MFVDEYAEAGEMEGTNPMFFVPEASVPGIAHGAAVTRTATGAAYKVRNVQPDGHGMVWLRLEEQ